jgi:hypothetical protein
MILLKFNSFSVYFLKQVPWSPKPQAQQHLKMGSCFHHLKAFAPLWSCAAQPPAPGSGACSRPTLYPILKDRPTMNGNAVCVSMKGVNFLSRNLFIDF